ncbi:MAG: hypothetical protein WAQ99_18655 [Pyrinomonadaceae bacterium]
MVFYTIMPVGADPQSANKKAILERVATELGLTPHFPYEKGKTVAFDINSTLSALKHSDFVLADLSMERPSCYFELGLAQAIGKHVYLIARKNTDIHQADRRNLTHFYTDLESYAEVVSRVLKEAKDARHPVRLRA